MIYPKQEMENSHFILDSKQAVLEGLKFRNSEKIGVIWFIFCLVGCFGV